MFCVLVDNKVICVYSGRWPWLIDAYCILMLFSSYRNIKEVTWLLPSFSIMDCSVGRMLKSASVSCMSVLCYKLLMYHPCNCGILIHGSRVTGRIFYVMCIAGKFLRTKQM
jgi:hypothetical protein